MLTVGDLRELFDCEELDDDTQVRLAIQPNYPLECHLDEVDLHEGVVYLTQGDDIGYLPGEVRNRFGW